MKTSRINQVMESGNSTWKDKTLTKYQVKFENGDTGTLTTGFQDNEKVPEVGDDLEYEIEDKGYGPEIKPKREGGTGFGGKAFKPNPKKDALIVASGIIKSLIDSGMEEPQAKLAFVEWFRISYLLIDMSEADLDTSKLPF